MRRSFLLDLFHPFTYGIYIRTYILESFSVVYAIRKHYPCGTFVVGLGNSPESLLTGSVPQLQPYPLVTNSQCFDLKIHAYGCHIVIIEVLIAESEDEVGLPDPTVANHYHLEHVVVGLFCWS